MKITQPRIEITLDAVERAINAMNDAYVVFAYNEVDGTALPKHEQMQKAMYAALDAALYGDKP